jgi:NAD(P)-dependent dehydrogenase (short-subunit alcohol dehydrogenase family)
LSHLRVVHEWIRATDSAFSKISDIVDAILHLKSAVFVTGEILHVDGEQRAGH